MKTGHKNCTLLAMVNKICSTSNNLIKLLIKILYHIFKQTSHKNIFRKLIFFAVILILSLPNSLEAKEASAGALQTSYKKVGDELVALRKQYPNVQTKIYKILDYVDQIYKVARVAVKQNEKLSRYLQEKETESKEMLKSKDLENISLQNEVIALKSVLDSTQHKLEVATKNLELEKKYNSKLSKDITKLSLEKKSLNKQQDIDGKNKLDHAQPGKNNRNKLESMAENSIIQSLNLTSSSAPRSPR